jgi:NhaP-type Na+/H+ or K+/H+ antiporter
MLLSLSLIVLLSLFLSFIASKLRLPRLIGMLLTGILLGPFVFNQIDQSILDLGRELRQIALVVILIRAGLSLDISDLKKIGRPALLLSFVPALFEMIAITLLAPIIFDISYMDAAILGSIIAAVSPAVIVPIMIELIHARKGHDKRIPHLILAGASIDDVFVIVCFSALLSIQQGGTFQMLDLLMVPLSIVLGALLGVAIGFILVLFFKRFHMRDTIKVLMLFSISFLCVVLENTLKDVLSISGLVAIMAIGVTILTKYPILAKRLVGKFEKIWVIAEIMLFVLVGAVLDLGLTKDVLFYAIILISLALIVRMLGVLIALIKTKLSKKEKTFVAISYIPKATVQAAIGSIPLSLGLIHAKLMLSIAIVAILFTAPSGAFLIDLFKERLLRD